MSTPKYRELPRTLYRGDPGAVCQFCGRRPLFLYRYTAPERSQAATAHSRNAPFCSQECFEATCGNPYPPRKPRARR